ncbi:superoxide dismutase family protein [Streptomyces sp. NPDC088387]|uniref:superoxide dismutase family protein n=1 Tax=Streptomyces sp. NPDC088387 TaxID=3365859 RepID=UPI0038245F34
MVAGIYVGVVAAAVFAAGAGSAHGAAAGADSDQGKGYRMSTDARFAPPSALVPSAALTYDTGLVPAGAWIQVSQQMAPSGATTVKLRVNGLEPGHKYGAHVHRRACGADPTAAGGHYQHKPSNDPADANPANEVWLDFTAARDGSGQAVAEHDWAFRQAEASSVVIHDQPGNHGTRVGCFTVPFGWAAGTS